MTKSSRKAAKNPSGVEELARLAKENAKLRKQLEEINLDKKALADLLEAERQGKFRD
ncbi:MAG: hypothetical protein Q3962_09415 [Corynebacterium sp.]|nr:hypothetical protein [Corynebacterium sp.]